MSAPTHEELCRLYVAARGRAGVPATQTWALANGYTSRLVGEIGYSEALCRLFDRNGMQTELGHEQALLNALRGLR